jgi:MoaA/NifB/PqqE/SkfB family radical SAM enzyme
VSVLGPRSVMRAFLVWCVPRSRMGRSTDSISFEKTRKAFAALQFVRGVLTGDTACAGPFYVTVDVTRRCNLKCWGCRFHSGEGKTAPDSLPLQDVPYDLVVRLCHELKAMGGSRLVLIGEGEPLMHPRLVDMISAAKDVGLEVFLITNGTLLDERVAPALVAAGLDKIQVSLWASSPEDYERNHPGTPAVMFDHVLRGVQFLWSQKSLQRKKRPRVILHQPINRYDFPNVRRFAELALATNCDGVSFSPLLTHRGKLGAQALTAAEELSFRRSLVQLRTWLRRQPLQHNIDEMLRRYESGSAVWEKYGCYIGWIDARVKPDGTVVPCNPCDLPMGNLHFNSLREIWNGAAYRAFRRKTLSREGLKELGTDCDCEFCCHLTANRRLHRVFGALAPFSRL